MWKKKTKIDIFAPTIECPKYSAALSEMYNNFPFCVSIIINPDKACVREKKKWRN